MEKAERRSEITELLVGNYAQRVCENLESLPHFRIPRF